MRGGARTGGHWAIRCRSKSSSGRDRRALGYDLLPGVGDRGLTAGATPVGQRKTDGRSACRRRLGPDGAMDHAQHNAIANFIWNIADDVLRDVYVRGKYRDVILPMTVIRRLDAVLEPTKKAVLTLNQRLEAAGVSNRHAALGSEAKQAFYNVSPFTLRD